MPEDTNQRLMKSGKVNGQVKVRVKVTCELRRKVTEQVKENRLRE